MRKKSEAKNATQAKGSVKDATQAKGSVKDATQASLTEEEKRKAHDKIVRRKNDTEMKNARKRVSEFMETQEYLALPDDVKKAIKRICGKKRATTGTDTFAAKLKEMFPAVSTRVSELDIFMKTKMGRGEFRKRIRETLKKAEPANRMWIEFNEDTEEWIYIASGIKQPKGFKGKAIE